MSFFNPVSGGAECFRRAYLVAGNCGAAIMNQMPSRERIREYAFHAFVFLAEVTFTPTRVAPFPAQAAPELPVFSEGTQENLRQRIMNAADQRKAIG
jgi:hypothetical protein